MADRIALKRLTASDLTFFESLFRTLDAGNQKSINLNADVFIEQLFPALPSLAVGLGGEIPVGLTILGPGGAGPYRMSRSIVKREAYKNWRLNGEFVRDPEDEPGRFDGLSAGDLAIIDFAGEPVPRRVTLVLIAANSASDAPLFGTLGPLVPGGRRTMASITREQIAAAAVAMPPTHPVWTLAADPEFEAALEDAAQDGAKGTEALRRRTGRTISAAVLAAAKAAAEKNGREGEALAWVHLQRMRDEGEWVSVEWMSKVNAVSSFDFRATDISGDVVMIDAKSTGGEFGRVLHMSMAELSAAADGHRYDVWRVFAIDESGAKLKIARDIGPMAKSILEGMLLPAGVTVDSVSIDPAALTWEHETTIERPEDPTADD